MSEDLYLRKQAARTLAPSRSPSRLWSAIRSGDDIEKCCAYNQTRQRFLSVDVEGADFSAAILKDRVPSLVPQSGLALWIVPFRGIPSTSVRVPVDLLCLDKNRIVIEAVEAFPLSQPDPSGKPADSVLALPAGSIVSTGTCAGDRLLLDTAENVKQRLQQTPATEAPPSAPIGKLLVWAKNSEAKTLPEADARPAHDTGSADPSHSTLSTASAASAATPAPANSSTAGEREGPKAAKSRGWLQRLLLGDAPDPRRATREPLSWIAAYFFTGGAPVAHSIRNISATGLYIFTEERWSPGTVLRTTLADRRDPSPERSITVNAKVVRWGNDGIGLQFVLAAEQALHKRHTVFGDATIAVNRTQIERFIDKLRGDPA